MLLEPCVKLAAVYCYQFSGQNLKSLIVTLESYEIRRLVYLQGNANEVLSCEIEHPLDIIFFCWFGKNGTMFKKRLDNHDVAYREVPKAHEGSGAGYGCN